MNKYGYFVYEDYPLNAQANVATNFNAQVGSESIIFFDRFIPEGYVDYASFEPNKFDFSRLIFTYDENEKMAYTSEAITDANGDFSQIVPTITITPREAYSGSGISLRTYNDYYKIKITVTDFNGTRSKTYDKTEDEFYPIPYNGLTSCEIQFLKLNPYNFIKVIGVAFGTVRMLTESDLIGEPEITNYFSYTGEELECDTLDFTIRGNKETFNVIAGERITYSKTGQVFYVDDAQQNNDGTISITCYDRVILLDRKFGGIMRDHSSVADVMQEVLGATVYDPINSTFSGSISTDVTFREAARLLLLGSGTRLYKKDWTARRFINDSATFTPVNIVSVPTIDTVELYKTISFNKHYFTKNKKDGKVEAFNGLLPPEMQGQQPILTHQVIYLTEPFASVDWYYVSGTDQDGNDILTPVTGDRFAVTVSGAYYFEVDSSYTERIVGLGYPYNESEYKLSITDEDIPITYRENTLEITDCSVIVDMGNERYTPFMRDLQERYKYNKKIAFDSVLEAEAGTIATMFFDGGTYIGPIIEKRNRLNGVYSYVVMARTG